MKLTKEETNMVKRLLQARLTAITDLYQQAFVGGSTQAVLTATWLAKPKKDEQ